MVCSCGQLAGGWWSPSDDAFAQSIGPSKIYYYDGQKLHGPRKCAPLPLKPRVNPCLPGI